MSRKSLLSTIGKSKKVKVERSHTNRVRDSDDVKKLKKESGEGWRRYRQLLKQLKIKQVAEKIHHFTIGAWIVFFAFLKDFNILSYNAETFMSREEVIASGGFVISWVILQAYKMGPLWVGFFTICAISGPALALLGLI